MSKKGCEVFADLMHDYGVSHVFYQDAIFRRGLRAAEERYGVKCVMTHSEGAAGCMADGYARASGRPGVCMAQSIGSANLAAGIKDAWLATTPVVAITGKKPPLYQHRNSYQEAQHKELFEDVTKFNAEVIDTNIQFEFLMRQCFKQAVTGKPRPTHIDVMGRDAVETDIDNIETTLGGEPMYGHYPPYRPMADSELVKKAAVEIAEAKRPVLVAGRGVNNSNAREILLELAQKCDIPVLTTPDGKTVIDESLPIWGGVVGNYGMNCANQTVRAADLVIYVGTQTSDQVTLDWTAPKPSTRVIQIDIAAEELGRSYPNSIGLCGDARAVLEQLMAELAEAKRPEWRAQVAENLADTDAKQNEQLAERTEKIHPGALCRELEKVLPDNAALVVDTCYTTIWAATMMRLKSTQRFYRATGNLGWSFPGSIGVKCGDPSRPVVCLTGDGGLFYYLSEMETLIRCGINTVTVIDNNKVLSACVPQTEQVFPDKVEEGIRKITFAPFSYAKIAEEFGLLGIRVEKQEDIGPAVQKALESGRPAVVEVMTQSVPHLPSTW